MTRTAAVEHIEAQGYGRDNAESWVLAAGFADTGTWSHPAGVLTVTWLGQDNYSVS